MKNVFTVLILAAASLSAAAQNCPVGIVSGQDSVRGMQFGVVASVAGAKARGVQLSGFSKMIIRNIPKCIIFAIEKIIVK